MDRQRLALSLLPLAALMQLGEHLPHGPRPVEQGELQQAMESKDCHLPVIFMSCRPHSPRARGMRAGGKVHRARVIQKLDVDSVAELVRFVDRLGQG